MSHITMDTELAEANARAIQAVVELNQALSRLRELKVSTAIREHDGRYYLDARVALSAVTLPPHQNKS